MSRGEGRVERFALHFLHHMWCDVVSTVGYGGSEIGYLQRSEAHLSLSDGYGYDGQSVP